MGSATSHLNGSAPRGASATAASLSRRPRRLRTLLTFGLLSAGLTLGFDSLTSETWAAGSGVPAPPACNGDLVSPVFVAAAQPSAFLPALSRVRWSVTPQPLVLPTLAPGAARVCLLTWSVEAQTPLVGARLQLFSSSPSLLPRLDLISIPISIPDVAAGATLNGEVWITLEDDPWRFGQNQQPVAALGATLVTPEGEDTRWWWFRCSTSVHAHQEQLHRWEIECRCHGESPFDALVAQAQLALNLGRPRVADALLSQARLHVRTSDSPHSSGDAARLWLARAQLHLSYAEDRRHHQQRCEDYLRDAEREASDHPDLQARVLLAWAQLHIEQALRSTGSSQRFEALDKARQYARSSREAFQRASTEGEFVPPTEWLQLWGRFARLKGWNAEVEETARRLLQSKRPLPREIGGRLLGAAHRDRARWDDAAEFFELAVRAHEELRDAIATDLGDGAFLRAHTARFGTTSYQLAASNALDRGDLWQAWLLLECSRARYDEAKPRPDQLRGLSQSLPPECCWVSHFVLDRELSIFVVTASALTVERVAIDPAELERQVRDFRNSHGTDAGLARELYQVLIAPIRAHLQQPQLFLAPYGIFRWVPFDALFDGRDYLVEHFETRQFPRAALAPPPQRMVPPRLLALLGPDTDYDGDGKQDQPQLAAADDGVAVLAEKLPGSVLLESSAARESAFRTQLADKCYVHISSHGEYLPLRPWRSALWLAAGDGEDGRLEASEITPGSLRQVELFTLSGCQTGLAQVGGGDDLAGFPRALLNAGAQRILGTLWRVEDEPASRFMAHFYRQLADGQTFAAALRRARLESLHSGEFSPATWGTWSLIQQHVWAKAAKEVILEKRHEGDSLPR